MIKRTNRRHLWLFSDVLLVAEPDVGAGKKATGREKIVVKQVSNQWLRVPCLELESPDILGTLATVAYAVFLLPMGWMDGHRCLSYTNM